MAYDIPKAAHFNAYVFSCKLAWNDRIGVSARWQAAHYVQSVLGVGNMLALTPGQLLAIRDYLKTAEPYPNVRLKLDEEYIARLS